MDKTIAISLSPNTQKDDRLLALKSIFTPISWYDFRTTEKLEKEFADLFGKEYKALAVNSGRSGEFLILKALGIGDGDEVMLQALTCVAVPNSIIWNNAKPIYLDVDESFNINPKDIREKISEKTRAVITQHSFGIPADISRIKRALKNKKIKIIEDCALSLGATYKGRKVGSLGDVSFFSFGRDKIISSVFGGMVLCKDRKLYEKIKEERDKLDYPSPFWVFQQIVHPLVLTLATRFYNMGFGRLTLGKAILFLSIKLGIISKAIYESEKQGSMPKHFPKKMPGVLSKFALKQLSKLKEFNNHRSQIVDIYYDLLGKSKLKLPPRVKGSVWVRFPVLTPKARDVFDYLKKRGILIGNWYSQIVDPVKKLENVGYKLGSCKMAEAYSNQMLNLPTYPNFSKEDAISLIKLIKKCLNTK